MRTRVQGEIKYNFLYDPNITFKAKGVLSFFIYLSNKGEFKIKDIYKKTSDSEYALHSAIKELVDNNYLVKNKYNGNKWEYVLKLNVSYKPY